MERRRHRTGAEQAVPQEMAVALRARYGDEPGAQGFGAGDPRRHMGSDHESAFVALHKGKVGILTEIEIDEAFAHDIETLQSDHPEWLANLERYRLAFNRNSDIFLACGEPVFAGRVAVCAFTELAPAAGASLAWVDNPRVDGYTAPASVDEALNAFVDANEQPWASALIRAQGPYQGLNAEPGAPGQATAPAQGV